MSRLMAAGEKVKNGETVDMHGPPGETIGTVEDTTDDGYVKIGYTQDTVGLPVAKRCLTIHVTELVRHPVSGELMIR